MKDDISQLLRAARLPAFARLYQQWRSDPGNADKSHDDLLRFLAADYLQWKLSRRVAAFMRRAHLPQSVSLLNVAPCPGLSARRLANLGRCGWLSGGRNLVIVGDCATDNTFLAGALAREAVYQTTAVQWRRMVTFVDQCSNANADDGQRTMKTLSRARLLVLDGFAENMTPASAATFLKELLDARIAAGLVTIVVSARPVEDWDTLFQDQKLANALFHLVLDRAVVIELNPSAKPKSVPALLITADSDMGALRRGRSKKKPTQQRGGQKDRHGAADVPSCGHARSVKPPRAVRSA